MRRTREQSLRTEHQQAERDLRANLAILGPAIEQGIRVVVCTGRRYRTALPLAQELGLTGPIVVNNGVLVKDIASGRTREHCYLPADVRSEVFSIIRESGYREWD